MSWIYIFQSYSEKCNKKLLLLNYNCKKKYIEFKFVGLNLAFRWKLWGGDELNLRLFCKSSIHACFMHVGFMKEEDRPATVLVLLVKNAKRVMNMIMVRGNILRKFAIWENQLEFNTNISLTLLYYFEGYKNHIHIYWKKSVAFNNDFNVPHWLAKCILKNDMSYLGVIKKTAAPLIKPYTYF